MEQCASDSIQAVHIFTNKGCFDNFDTEDQTKEPF